MKGEEMIMGYPEIQLGTKKNSLKKIRCGSYYGTTMKVLIAFSTGLVSFSPFSQISKQICKKSPYCVSYDQIYFLK